MSGLTRWFPPHIKPARDGVYQIAFKDGSARGCYAMFSDGLWGTFNYTLAEAAVGNKQVEHANQEKCWRGLATPASKEVA